MDGTLDIKTLLKFEFSAILDKPKPLPLKVSSNKVEITSKYNVDSASKSNKSSENLENPIKIIEKPEQMMKVKSPTISEPIIPIDKNLNLIKLRVISTWGNVHNAGLTEIQLFSINSQKIELKPCDISIKNTSFQNAKAIKNMINGVYKTIDEENMWFAYMPEPPSCLEICILIKNDITIGGLLIWNYNKSLIESIKGIKEIEILLNNELKWAGVIKRGVGNETDDYQEAIKLMPNFDFSSRIVPKVPLMEETHKEDIPFKNKPIIIDDKLQHISSKNLIIIEEKGGEGFNKTKQGIDHKESMKNSEDLTNKNKLGDESMEGGRKTANRTHPKTYKLFEEIENNEISRKTTGNKNKGEEKIIDIFVKTEKNDKNEEKNQEKLMKSEKNLIQQDNIMRKSEKFLENPQKFRIVEKNNKFIVKTNEKPEKIETNEKILEKFDKNDKILENAEKMQKCEENPFSKKQRKPTNDSKSPSNFPSTQTQIESDPLNLEKLLYFNLTNEGRLRPGSRERFLQAEAQTMQEDVQKTLKILQNNLSLNEEYDALDVFFKKDQSKSIKSSEIRPNIIDKPVILDKNKDNKLNNDDIKGIFSEYKPINPVSTDNKANFNDNKAVFNDNKVNYDKIYDKSIINTDDFIIPNLPKGRFLTFNLLSTWGDQHYIGLAGIEIFNDRGHQLKLHAFQIKADPPDINILPGYGSDPRTIDKLVDGVYMTCDDLHMWLAPFNKGKDHMIWIDLEGIERISMIRMWNYNKSRIHSFRGVKHIKVLLDDRLIFIGDIMKASGTMENCKDRCEYIMFCDDETIFKAIDERDWLNRFASNKENEKQAGMSLERPKTGTRVLDEKELKELQELINVEGIGIDGRPLTSVRHIVEKNKEEEFVMRKNEKGFDVIKNKFTILMKFLTVSRIRGRN